MNIVLCGMMGVGKSSVGVRLAELTGRRWLDTDVMITDRYGRISDIFEYYGEAHFRMLETELVTEISALDNLVISTGGGLVLKPENGAMLKERGKIIFLRATIDTLVSRVYANDSRPLIQHVERSYDKLSELLTVRTPIYEHVADYIVDTDDKTVDDVAAEILSLLEREA